jgi:predicted permease
LYGLSPGFDPRNVVSASASLQDARYQTAAAVNRLFDRSLDQIRRIPGVESAAVALTMPYERPLNFGFRRADGPDSAGRAVETVYTTPGYLATMRIPLLRGREFRASDSADAPAVALVSQAFVNRHFRGEEPIGRQLIMSRVPRTIVGIAGDVQQHSGLGNYGPISIDPTVYLPAAQTPGAVLQVVHVWFSPKWVVRTTGPIVNLAPQVQAAIASADPLLPVAKFQTVADLKAGIMGDQRYQAALFSIVAALALLLAAIGLYGLISNSVAQRTHELGIRLALGATPGQAISIAIRPGLLLAIAGSAVGTLVSLAAVRLLAHMLWGVKPVDAVTFAATAALLLLVAAFASIAPALRILRLDPAQTLRR